MKNIHIIPTDKSSRLGKFIDTNNLFLRTSNDIPRGKNINIYITSDEEIKEGDWFYDGDGELCKYTSDYVVNPNSWNDNKKIILTTDQDLIKDGVQAIDDEFLEWFVKNPSCEVVEIEEVYPLICCIQKEGKTKMNNGCMERNRCLNYKIIIPKEEPEQEDEIIDISDHDGIGNAVDNLNDEPPPKKEPTLEEAAENFVNSTRLRNYKVLFIEGAKWQEEQDKNKYSEEEVHKIIESYQNIMENNPTHTKYNDWFEQFKKK